MKIVVDCIGSCANMSCGKGNGRNDDGGGGNGVCGDPDDRHV